MAGQPGDGLHVPHLPLPQAAGAHGVPSLPLHLPARLPAAGQREKPLKGTTFAAISYIKEVLKRDIKHLYRSLEYHVEW